MSDQVTGQELQDIANNCWRENAQRYSGFNWNVAVGQAKKQIERKRGNRKDRREEAEHTVQVLFDHARAKSQQVADNIARQAQESGGDQSDLQAFAAEVSQALNGPLSGGFGVVDPAMIIGLISAIITGVQQCKALKPKPPAPTPTPTPTPAQ